MMARQLRGERVVTVNDVTVSYDVVDRGFGECWWPRCGQPKRRAFFAAVAGPLGEGQLYQHTCERWNDGRNYCINPAHFFIGTHLSNRHHMLRLKEAAGISWKGLPHAPFTPEHRAAISAAMTGKRRGPLSPEHRAKVGASLRGREFTPEWRAKISAGRKGK